MKTIKFLSILLISTLLFTACSSEDPTPVNEEEVITTVTITLSNSRDIVTLQSRDLDGDGPNPPVVTISGNLTANSTYNGTIKLENETESPAENVTTEVTAEADEHEFFYTSTVSGLTITKTDMDGNGNPIGIAFTVDTGAAGTGNFGVILKHEPTKPNNNTAVSAGGSTDVDVTFTNVTVQ